MSTPKDVAIAVAVCVALIAVAFSYVALGLCLAQPLEDASPTLVNVGALAVLAAVGIGTFRFVFRKLRGAGDSGVP